MTKKSHARIAAKLSAEDRKTLNTHKFQSENGRMQTGAEAYKEHFTDHKQIIDEEVHNAQRRIQ